jgi:hypothetical protein
MDTLICQRRRQRCSPTGFLEYDVIPVAGIQRFHRLLELKMSFKIIPAGGGHLGIHLITNGSTDFFYQLG